MEKELEYIKLKVDWYKSIYPWILAMVIGNTTLIQFIFTNQELRKPITFILIVSNVLLLITLLCMWYAALALIHRLEEPYKSKNYLLRILSWTFVGARSEAFFGNVAAGCLGGGVASFCAALVVIYLKT